MNLDELSIRGYLRFGYFFSYRENRAPIDYSRIDKQTYEHASFDDLVRTGVQRLRETLAQNLEHAREQVVPLSGGLDSRLILGGLLEHVEATDIHTFTFGRSGSYDYEIGTMVAKEVGTRHVAIPLEKESYSVEEEIAVALRTDCQGVLFHHPPLWKLDQLYAGALFWSGYVGDAVAGSYLKSAPSSTLEVAKRVHLASRRLVKSVDLHRCPEEDFLPLMAGGGLDPEILSWDEQVLFNEAAAKFTAPLVLFRGYDFVTPFINTPWMDFMLSVPNRFRAGQALMIAVSRAACPRLFSMPSKNRLGHTFDTPHFIVKGTFWFNRVRKLAHQFMPRVNWANFQYNDFDEGIRSDVSLRRVVRSSIDDLRLRGICDWVDFEGIWRRHLRRVRNHGDALIALASLEIVLKAREGTEAC